MSGNGSSNNGAPKDSPKSQLSQEEVLKLFNDIMKDKRIEAAAALTPAPNDEAAASIKDTGGRLLELKEHIKIPITDPNNLVDDAYFSNKQFLSKDEFNMWAKNLYQVFNTGISEALHVNLGAPPNNNNTAPIKGQPSTAVGSTELPTQPIPVVAATAKPNTAALNTEILKEAQRRSPRSGGTPNSSDTTQQNNTTPPTPQPPTLQEALGKLDADKKAKAIKILEDLENVKLKNAGELQQKREVERQIKQLPSVITNIAASVKMISKEGFTNLRDGIAKLKSEGKKDDDPLIVQKIEQQKQLQKDMEEYGKKQKLTEDKLAQKTKELAQLDSKLADFELIKKTAKRELDSLGLNFDITKDYDASFLKKSVSSPPEEHANSNASPTYGTPGPSRKEKLGCFADTAALQNHLDSLGVTVDMKSTSQWSAKDDKGKMYVIEPNTVTCYSKSQESFEKMVDIFIAGQKAKHGKDFDIGLIDFKASGDSAKEIEEICRKKGLGAKLAHNQTPVGSITDASTPKPEAPTTTPPVNVSGNVGKPTKPTISPDDPPPKNDPPKPF